MTTCWGIISTGRHPNKKIVPAMKLAEGTRVVAAYSRDMGRAQAFAQKHDIRAAYDSLQELLNDRRIDAVFIASPNYLHALHTKMAAEAGKHVLVEKPMAVSVNEALEMVDTCRKQGVRLGVAFNLRHHPGHRKARQLVWEGILGRIAMAKAEFFYLAARGVVEAPPRPALSEWWEKPEMIGGGATIMGTGVHTIDLLQFILGQPVTEVAAITDGQRADRPLDNTCAIALRFREGPIGTATCGRLVPDAENNATIYGSDGRITLRSTLWEAFGGALEVVSDSVNLTEAYERNLLTCYKLQIEAFNRAVQQDEKFDASGIDGLSVVQVTSAVIESASTGRAIKIEEIQV